MTPIPINSMTARLPFSPTPAWFYSGANFMKALQGNPNSITFHSNPFLPGKQALSTSSSKINADVRKTHSHALLLEPIRPLESENGPRDDSSSDKGLEFREKLVYLEVIGIDSIKALTNNPSIHSTSLERMRNVIEFLEQKGLKRKDMGRIFGMFPQILTSSIDKDLKPVFNFLTEEVKIPEKDLRKTIYRCPRLLVCSVKDQLRPTLYYLQRLGFVDKHSITCADTILLVFSVEQILIPKLEYLQSVGLSYKDVVLMVVRSPGLFTYSIANNFQPKFDYLVNEMGYSLDDLKRFPQYFSFSLENRIKPRHKILVEYNVSLPLPTMLKTTDSEFREIVQRLHVGSQKPAKL